METTEGNCIISCVDLGFSYRPGKQILQGVSFDADRGETLSVAGLSGCGKSTLLRIISGILPNGREQDVAGQVVVAGKTTTAYRLSGKLSFMFQEPGLMPNLTVGENIGLTLAIRQQENKIKVEEMLEKVGLSEFRDRLPKELSGGMKTRVALARSFITEPEILLLDEPFSSLDIAWRQSLYRELEMLRSRCGTTVILVTHDVQEALLLSNKVLLLTSDGKVGDIYPVASSLAVADRVSDISGFMGEVYQSHVAPIQDAIIADQEKTKKKHEKIALLSVA